MQLITREELKASLDANHHLKLLMVVGPWEFRARHIPGSVGYPAPGPQWTPSAVAADPSGTADTGKTCKAAVDTSTTAGPATAGHPPQPPLLWPRATSNLPSPGQPPRRTCICGRQIGMLMNGEL